MAAVARLIPASAWETRSCGRGGKGHRDYEWAWAATASPQHWVLIRRGLSDSDDLAFYYCHAPEGRPVSLPPADLSTCARALLAVPAARPATRGAPARCQYRRPARGLATPGKCPPAPGTGHPVAIRPGQGQRPRGPSAGPPSHRAHEPRRPRPRPRLVTMMPTPPGPRPIAPPPRPAPGRPRHLTQPEKTRPSRNKPGL